MIHNVWLIPTIMLLAALINGLGVRKLGKLAGHVAWIGMALCTLISFGVLFNVMDLAHKDAHWHGEHISLWTWMELPNFFGAARNMTVEFAFHVDQLTAVFLCFVSFIGLLVFIYATGYMKEKHHGHLEPDPGYARFFSYVSLFAASMFILVLGANMPVMFIGWEGVGLCSYLLIGYFFDKPFSEVLSCADAGRKAFVMNRIGDAGMIIGMGLLFWGLGTLDFQELSNMLAKAADPATRGVALDIPAGFKYNGALITAATLCLFFGATGKSAQIPLFTWLPDAMAGPTPVSALIHAATMVTAGVYMVARLNVAFFMAPQTMAVIAVIGGVTAFAAATMGLTQRGIKKALAYSTVSQLGFMFLALGVGSMAGGIFHVFTHAFFKGCLFLCAGSVIHAMHHEEDMFKMGGLRKHMPITALTYFAATICIAGVPLTSGFFSKDEILFHAWLSNTEGGVPILYILAAITALMTAIYMGRTYFLTFEGPERMDAHTKEHLHESPANITGPLVVLAVLALLVGALNLPHFVTDKGAHFHHFLAPVVDRGAEAVATARGFNVDHEAGNVPIGPLVLAGVQPKDMMLNDSQHGWEFKLALFSGFLALLGLGISWLLFAKGPEGARKLKTAMQPLWSMSLNCWWWDAFYRTFFQRGSMQVAQGVWEADIRVVDGAVNGIGRLCRRIGRDLRSLQSGQVQIYGLVMFIGVCMFMVYFAFGLGNFLTKTARAKAHAPARPAAVRVEARPVAPPPAQLAANRP